MSQTGTETRQEFEELIKLKSHELQAFIERGDLTGAMAIIQQLQDAREQTLYKEVGRLTRGLHNAITNFHIDARPDENPTQLSEMADATDRLDYVVKMTEDAANKTMDKVDECMPIANDLGNVADELRAEWQRLSRREMSADEFRELYWRIGTFLDRLSTDSKSLYTHLSDILLAQDFQDLTGQVIQRVTGLVRDVEKSLVDLVLLASKVENVAGFEHKDEPEEKEHDVLAGHGPSVKKTEDVVSSQDDVDDLLSSLGF